MLLRLLPANLARLGGALLPPNASSPMRAAFRLLAASPPNAARLSSTSPTARKVAKGDRVSIRFEAKDAQTGESLVHSGPEPVSCVVGHGHIIPGMEKRLLGMAVGESWSESIQSHEAFGESDPRRIVRTPKPANLQVNVGHGVQLASGEWARVVEVTEQEIVVDMNHPLAGKAVVFDVQLLGISEEPRNVLSGVSIEQIIPGDGKTFPRSGQTVSVHYTGTLASDGKEFDSSRSRGKPFSFVLGAGLVIKGWEIGIGKLSLGERAVLHIPSEFAYGDQGAGGVIPADADLNFDVHLVAIDHHKAV
jgi:FK506-binding protein 1